MKSKENTMVQMLKIIEKKVIPKSGLFGLIHWYETVSKKEIGTELHIFTKATKVYVNRRRIL